MNKWYEQMGMHFVEWSRGPCGVHDWLGSGTPTDWASVITPNLLIPIFCSWSEYSTKPPPIWLRFSQSSQLANTYFCSWWEYSTNPPPIWLMFSLNSQLANTVFFFMVRLLPASLLYIITVFLGKIHEWASVKEGDERKIRKEKKAN